MPPRKITEYRYRAVFEAAPKPPLLKGVLKVAEGKFKSSKPEGALMGDLKDHLRANGIAEKAWRSLIITQGNRVVAQAVPKSEAPAEETRH